MIEKVETDLWIAVIEQSLFDASLGIAVRKRKLLHVGGTTVKAHEVRDARRFLKGDDGSLKTICDALGMDYKIVRADLLRAYNACVPYMPREWKQVIT